MTAASRANGELAYDRSKIYTPTYTSDRLSLEYRTLSVDQDDGGPPEDSQRRAGFSAKPGADDAITE